METAKKSLGFKVLEMEAGLQGRPSVGKRKSGVKNVYNSVKGSGKI